MAKKGPRNKVVNENLTLSNGKTVTDRIVKVTALNEEQKNVLKVINENEVTFIVGVSGTGKTHLAVGYGLQEMKRGRFDRIIFTRPYVEAGEKLGYLPGNFDTKTAPFMIPMYEVVRDYFNEDDICKMIEDRQIVVLPLAYMRGITFRRSYVIADEAQNATPQQMHLLLTRIGENSKIVVTGDIYQSDLRYQINGLLDAVRKLQGIDNLAFVEMTYQSCVRSKIVQSIDSRYRKDQPAELNVSDLLNPPKTIQDTQNITAHVDDRGGVVYED